jgi:hypothetical protein
MAQLLERRNPEMGELASKREQQQQQQQLLKDC